MNAVAVPARIDVDNAVEVLETLSQALAASLRADAGGAAQPLALDIATLEYFDSSALSLLLQLARNNVQVGDNSVGDADQEQVSPLFFLNPPPKLRELAQLYGVEEMLFRSEGAGG